MPHVVALYRHPVKGFSAEPIDGATLAVGSGFPRDRHFAFVSGRKPETPKPGGWVQPRTFLMQAVDPQLAAFTAHFDDASGALTITAPDGHAAVVHLGQPDTYAKAEALLAAHFEAGSHADIRLVEQDGKRGNWDFSDTEVSIINLATMREIEKACGVPLVKERFRGNVYIDGLAPWEEFSWPGRQLAVGNAVLDIMRPIQRCAMTSTTPGTGARDIDLPATMRKAFGHIF
ncbi:MAG: MOSC N-terminal beta barrel domain-containing protein, partial [Pseudomonadota bacterium]